MSDEVNKVVADAKAATSAEVKSLTAKVEAFLQKHVPTVVGTLLGYAGGHFGVVGAIVKHFA